MFLELLGYCLKILIAFMGQTRKRDTWKVSLSNNKVASNFLSNWSIGIRVINIVIILAIITAGVELINLLRVLYRLWPTLFPRISSRDSQAWTGKHPRYYSLTTLFATVFLCLLAQIIVHHAGVPCQMHRVFVILAGWNWWEQQRPACQVLINLMVFLGDIGVAV